MPVSTYPCLRAASLLALIAASPAKADDDQPRATQGEDIVVTAALAEGVGVGTKLPIKLVDTPQTISILDRKRLDDQHLTTLDDVMAAAPGITTQPGSSLRTAYYARGFAITSLNFDGIPTSGWNEAVNTEDMAIYERVELLRGSGGLLQGTGNPSGTINLVRKRPGEDFAANGSVSAGSWNNYRAEGDITVPITKDGALRSRVIGVLEDRDYYYDVGHRRKYLAYGTVEWNIDPRTVLAATVKWQEVHDKGVYMGVPLYSDGGVLSISRSTFPGADWSRRNWNNVQIFGELRHDFGHGWDSKLSLTRIIGNSDLTYASAYGAVSRATGLGSILYGGAYAFRNRETDLDGYISGGFDLLGRHHQVLLGANYWDGHTRQTSYSLPGLNQSVNLFSDTPTTTPEPATRTWAGEQTTDTRQYGGYGVIRFKLLDPLTLIGGGRLSWWDTSTIRQAAIGGPLTPTGSYAIAHRFTPYGGLVWHLTGPINAYGSYATIFSPQNYLTYEGATIAPMTGNTIEAGLKGAWNGGKLNASAALFRIRQNNRAQLDPSHPCVTGQTCAYIAEGAVQSKGIDTEVQGEIMKGWTVQAGYTFTATKYLRDSAATGQTFSSFTPKHMIKVWSHYQLPVLHEKLGVGAGLNWQSRFYVVSNGITLSQGAYAVAHIRADYAVTPKVQLGLNLNNLFDKTYFTSLSSTAWNNWYGEPRSITATLKARY